jgi:hypothetical protein
MVYVAMMLEKDFYTLTPTTDGAHYRGMQKESAQWADNHAMAIVGMRRTAAGQRQFRLVNSWDLSWCDAGCFWIDEDVLFADGFDFWAVTQFNGMKPYVAPVLAPGPDTQPVPQPTALPTQDKASSNTSIIIGVAILIAIATKLLGLW